MSTAADFVPRICVGIDFGTIGVAAAYCMLPATDDFQPKLVTSLGGTMSEKAPTRVAVTRSNAHDLIAFGRSVNSYHTSGESPNTLVFHRFKMVLYSEATAMLSRDVRAARLTANVGGATVPTVTVIARCLQAIQHEVVNEVNTSFTAFKITPQEYLWVLTVPAIWSEGAKSIMRQAAVEAGLIRDPTSAQLRLALEPECAALEVYNHAFDIRAGTKYIVVDAGGGTVDITVHRIRSTPGPGSALAVEELHKATGNDLGGTAVDREFIAFLHDLLPEVNLQHADAGSGALFELMTHSWEPIKQEWGKGDSSEAEGVAVSLRDLDDMVPDFDLPDRIATFNTRHPDTPLALGRARGTAVLPRALMARFFATPIAGIVRHLEGLMQHPNVAGARRILLVGGFANCVALQSAIRDFARPLGMDVIVPPKPHLAVVNGAVRFGVHPEQITERRSRFTYGIEHSDMFDAQKGHPATRKVRDAKLGRDVIHKLFRHYVVENEAVPVNKEVEHSFIPMYDDQDTMVFRIMASPKAAVEYTDETMEGEEAETGTGTGSEGRARRPAVRELARISLPVTAVGAAHTKICKAKMRFGSTEIEVYAETPQGHRRINIDFRFL